jgi:hypothetical protein
MSEKKNSAAQRVLRSIVAPAIGTSIALLMGCSTQTPPDNSKPTAVKPETNDHPPYPGTVAPPQTQGAVVAPASTPASAPITNQIPPPGIVPRPEIPDPGKIMPPKIEEVGKIDPGEPEKVGKVAPMKPGKISPPKPQPPAVGTVTKPGMKVGIKMEPTDNIDLRGEERPTRATRRTTDSNGGVQRTGFVGGRKLS